MSASDPEPLEKTTSRRLDPATAILSPHHGRSMRTLYYDEVAETIEQACGLYKSVYAKSVIVSETLSPPFSTSGGRASNRKGAS